MIADYNCKSYEALPTFDNVLAINPNVVEAPRIARRSRA